MTDEEEAFSSNVRSANCAGGRGGRALARPISPALSRDKRGIYLNISRCVGVWGSILWAFVVLTVGPNGFANQYECIHSGISEQSDLSVACRWPRFGLVSTCFISVFFAGSRFEPWRAP